MVTIINHEETHPICLRIIQSTNIIGLQSRDIDTFELTSVTKNENTTHGYLDQKVKVKTIVLTNV